MRVVPVSDPGVGEPAVQLVDGQGRVVEDVAAFLRALTVRRFSPNTVRAYAHDLQKLMLFLEEQGLTVQDFTPARAMDFLVTLRRTPSTRKAQRLELAATVDDGRLLSPRTCNRILAAVSSFYEFLITCERYDGRENPILKQADSAALRAAGRWRPPLLNSKKQIPVRRTLRVKTVDSLPRPLPDETYRALILVMRTKRDRALLELMHEGGLRPGEALGLCLEDISYGRRRVTIRHRDSHPKGVRQKSRRERVVDLLEDRALPAINDYVLRERPQDAETDYVFLVGGGGKRRHEPLSYDGMVRMFARAAERAGVRDPWLTPHALRHTHATRMFEGGMRELTLMARLGHASPDSTKIYTRISDHEVAADYRRALESEDSNE
ncbi:transposase [Mycolicibacterium wolinskyi]|uniref:Transposase n=1 Tax=Mycolicibacterium wolinskyi TaxID=59750 RepID=A0A132PB10_9MYCO|nr:tyrosine-type recombinase/integrase [Mycolicibacterium wolinskyi]KWX19447.1 transposase [Mycolicibacterium wolinskyi]